ncbi:hypothetical protein ACIHFE_34330 [Streptomyces sp. NPDC052396]|uniref:hypothetical protein n=1 Tax=Streptomyces sp. NPDC052396 TaxID=3365689 RepID=UPI0037D4BB21
MTVDEVLKEAAARGITNLPAPSHLTHVRVWPAHEDRWVAEIGQPPRNETVGELHTTKNEARAAGTARLHEVRAKVRAALPEDLASAMPEWPDPIVNEWD